MLTEPESGEGIDVAVCQCTVKVIKDKDEERIIVCGNPTSWRCDVCLGWVCHEHFGTYNAGPDESKHEHVCHECDDYYRMD